MTMTMMTMMTMMMIGNKEDKLAEREQKDGKGKKECKVYLSDRASTDLRRPEHSLNITRPK